ncbi:MAG: imidazoleglycerol-phosphate dehydratase [Rectinemataceae bacterium]
MSEDRNRPGLGADPEPEAIRSRRRAALRRSTRETVALLLLDLDGGESGGDRAELVRVDTGIGFLDHLVSSLAFHAGWSLDLVCRGDLEVDDHHSVEDSAILLGEALSRALSSGDAPARFGWACAVLDESLARAVVDLSGRPYAAIDLGLGAASLGAMRGENAEHFLSSLAYSARMTLHVDVERGTNSHHRAEAAFKATALALKAACARPEAVAARRGEFRGERSTKGSVALESIEPSAFAEASERIRDRMPGRRAGGAPEEAAGGRAAKEGR